MRPFTPLLLDVWTEACRHIEIGEAVTRLTPLLAKRLPFDLLLVRRLDLSRTCVESVATGQGKPGPIPDRTHCELKPEEMERLIGWCRDGKVVRFTSESKPASRAAGLLPPGVQGQVLAGPLNGEQGPIGLLVLVARAARSFTGAHELIVQALLEPFTMALENDGRLREMTKLREAAEADKRSLLTRLGRQDISDTIVGADAGLRPVIERVELVAHTDAPVLIFGETGSGKEVVARAIHDRSRRARGPFLRVNCGAIPSELIDSELFGHERGSFTGAINMRQGWFERADGGTLFLDEIGELPLAAQVRLLRILQDGSFERVGGQRQLKVDVRIVGATHRDLQRMVQEGRFREDLWYRLAVFPVHLPSLRERVQDIPALATHFALKASRRFGTPALLPSPEDINLLVAYPWPGNVRELGSVMERAAILGNGQRLEVSKAIGTAPPPLPGPAEPVTLPHHEPHGPFPTLDTAMSRHIEAALNITRGRIEGPDGAARLLGINPHTLRARMRKLKVDWKQIRVAARNTERPAG